MTAKSRDHTVETRSCSDLETWEEGTKGGAWDEKHNKAGLVG